MLEWTEAEVAGDLALVLVAAPAGILAIQFDLAAKPQDCLRNDHNPLLGEAARQSGTLGCPFADALSPALAALLGAPLVSANPHAHAAFPGVRLIQSP